MKVVVKTAITSLVLALVCALSAQAAHGLDVRRSGPTGRFVVKLKSGVKAEPLSMALSSEGQMRRASALQVKPGLSGGEFWDRIYLFEPTDSTLTAPNLAAMIGSDRIEYVEPEYWLEFFAWPEDSLFPNQWYLHNEGQSYLSILRLSGYENDRLVSTSGEPGVDINIVPYYDNPPSETTAVVVGIIDSGVDLIHPELAGRFWTNPDEIPGNGVDDDHNGFVDDTLGYDVSGDEPSFFDPQGDNDPTDEHGHGTHLAGIVAANANREGVVGVAPWVEIMPVKIQPNATTAIGAAGIVYAVNSGARIINLSWGTPFESAVLRDAISFARNNGVLATIAAGNTGDNTRYFPAAFDSTFVVAAGNSRGDMTYFSTFGAHIDIVAPGQDILSLRATGTDMYAENGEPGVRIIDSLYYLADGTSMSAPAVAGAAALMLSFRPDLSLAELEEILLHGADDMIDPLSLGDSLTGPDTVSGWGYLNTQQSLQLLQQPGLALAEPIPRNRYTGDFEIKVNPVGGYEGSWTLHYSVGSGSEDWQFLAAGDALPADSVLHNWTNTSVEGFLNFRLTDRYGSSATTTCTHVRNQVLHLDTPVSGSTVQYNIPITGSVYGPGFDSVRVSYRRVGHAPVDLLTSTGEYFDSLIYDWTVSGVDTGDFVVHVYGYFDATPVVDSADIHIRSAFADGWPRSVPGLIGLTTIVSNLDHAGARELIVPTSRGLYVFDAYGNTVPGFPVLTDTSMICVPAVYDVDRDGDDEIIATGDSLLHVFNHDGTYALGFPVSCYTGSIPYRYGYPMPTVTRLGMYEDSAIVFLNKRGEIMAWELDGDPYFYSLQGLFATLDPRISSFYNFGGFTSPFVSSYDVTGDGFNEVVASYTAPPPNTGLALFDGRTGQPVFDPTDPFVQRVKDVMGTVLTDLNGDALPELITLGRDQDNAITLWAKTQGQDDLPGWPVTIPDVTGWIGSYPIAADLDLDGSPEILCAFFEFDVGAVYAFRADGSPYITRAGKPSGELYSGGVTFATPMAANLTGDEYPEIVIRSGHVLPNTGRELIHILDYQGNPLPGWPVPTPTRPAEVFSSRYAPTIDDLDGDGLVELIIPSDGSDILVWNFDASYEDGANYARFGYNNVNNGVYTPLRQVPTGVDDDEPSALPSEPTLAQNYPNPFNPSTTIEFSLPRAQKVNLDVFNILGQKVVTLVDQTLGAGSHRVSFDGSDYASGVFMYRLKTDDYTATRKMTMIK